MKRRIRISDTDITDRIDIPVRDTDKPVCGTSQLPIICPNRICFDRENDYICYSEPCICLQYQQYKRQEDGKG